MGRQRSRQERLFDKERSQFKDQLAARKKEIQLLKRERQEAEERVQVRHGLVMSAYALASLVHLVFVLLGHYSVLHQRAIVW